MPNREVFSKDFQSLKRGTCTERAHVPKQSSAEMPLNPLPLQQRSSPNLFRPQTPHQPIVELVQSPKHRNMHQPIVKIVSCPPASQFPKVRPCHRIKPLLKSPAPNPHHAALYLRSVTVGGSSCEHNREPFCP